MHAIIRTKKHKSVESLRSREAHTYRKRPTPNANPNLVAKNKLLFGREDYGNFCDEKLKIYETGGAKIRKDAVLCIEYLLTASPEFFDAGALHERRDRLKKWCDAQVDYLKKQHGEENILNIFLHLDEKTPHIEAYVLPIDPKGKLNCKHFLGGPAKLSKLQTDYASHNKKFALQRGIEGSHATHSEVRQFYTLIQQQPPITESNLADALKLRPPGIKDLMNVSGYFSKEQKRITKNIKRLFAGVIKQAKLVKMTEKLVLSFQRQENEFKKKEYRWANKFEAMEKEVANINTQLLDYEKLGREFQEMKDYAERLKLENEGFRKKSQAKKVLRLTPEKG